MSIKMLAVMAVLVSFVGGSRAFAAGEIQTEVQKPEIHKPEVQKPEVHRAEVQKPEIHKPEMQKPEVHRAEMPQTPERHR
ncbi:MAG: hypothetical protein WCH20_15930 [Nitrospira sp.]